MSEEFLSSRSLLSLLQWCDSLFPTGAFSHSFGLESAVQSGRVHDGGSLRSWIEAKLIQTVLPMDAVLLSQAHRAADRQELETLRRLDAEGFAMRIPRECREGGKMIALRLIQSAAELHPSPWMLECFEALRDGALKGDPAVAFGIAGSGAGIPQTPTLLGYLYIFVAGQVSAGLRLFPLGQREGQRLIRELLDQIDRDMVSAAPENHSPKVKERLAVLDDPDRRPSSFAPALEIGAMRHESAAVRLFQS